MLTIFGLFVIMLGLLQMRSDWKNLVFGLRSRGWPETDARVEFREEGFLVRASRVTMAYRMYLKASKHLRGPVDTVEPARTRKVFSYVYCVDGVEYASNRISFCPVTQAPGWILSANDVHVRVRYNPANPSQAVMLPGIGVRNVVGFIPGLILVALGAGTVALDYI